VSDDRPEPPPPPPNLSPPPGYAAYTGASSGRIKTILTMRTIVIGVLVLLAASGIYQLTRTPGLVDTSKDFLADRIDEDQFTDEFSSGVNTLLFLPFAACVVASVMWLYQLIRAHQDLGRRGSWGPGWAISGWILPPFVLYVIPMLVLRETWRAADPDVPLGDDRWRNGSVHPLLWVWWVLYGLAPLVFTVMGLRTQIGNIGADEKDIAESFVDNSGLLYAQSIVSLLAVVAWGGLVYLWTDRHQRLTARVGR
jgi:hypothetical protein